MCAVVFFILVLYFCSDVYFLDGVLVTCIMVASVCGLLYISSDNELMKQDAQIQYYTNIMHRHCPVSEV
jgi:hypothetical protein